MIRALRPVRHLLVMAAVLASLIPFGTAHAQSPANEPVFYLRPQIGLGSYSGDRSSAFISFDGGFPFTFGLELEYAYQRPISFGVNYQLGNYPGIGADETAAVRHSLDFLLRYAFSGSSRNTPYAIVGGHFTFGSVDLYETGTSASRVAVGPLVGFGLEFPWRSTTAFFAQATIRAAFPDENLDGRASDSGAGFDLLTSLGAGLKFGLASRARAPQILSIDGPATLDLQEPGTFSANIAEGATQPVEYRWDWGDGESSAGRTATHAFGIAGSYTVRFTASNRAGSSSAVREVQVVRPIAAPRIDNIVSDPERPGVGVSVRFRADVRGTEPLTYEWSFGDGGTATGATPVHTFSAPDLYAVALTVSNEGGSDTQTLPLRVEDTRECSEVIELNSIFFQRNSSTLSREGRNSAEENAQYLNACPAVNVRLEGWAAPGERNPRELSEDRARVVAEFYRGQGINPRRMTTAGMGRALGNTSKKEGGAQNQRVDTIPLQ